MDPIITQIAKLVIRRYGNRFHYVAPKMGWYIYDGQRWKPDPHGTLVLSYVRKVILALHRKATEQGNTDARKVYDKLCDVRWYEVVAREIRLIRGDKDIQQLDADHYLMNTKNDTSQLGRETIGMTIPASAQDYMTKMAGGSFIADDDQYERRFSASQFKRFLDMVQPDPAVQRLMAQHAGHGALGDASGQKAAFHLGPSGQNGKSAYHMILVEALGTYAHTAPAGLFIGRETKEHQIAALRGVRFLVVQELPANARWKETLFKEVVGGDNLTGSEKFKGQFTFRSTCTVSVPTNHMPLLLGGDGGTARRIMVIPWEVRIPDQKLHAVERMVGEIVMKELDVVLSWIIRGLRDYFENGWVIPPVVADATYEYLHEDDPVEKWISSRCQKISSAKEYVSDLKEDYDAWAEVNREEKLNLSRFTGYLSTNGVHPYKRTEKGVLRKGLSLGKFKA
ncbi:DNA primase family protein [Gordonia rhizosphera]|uniref:SF3 helicase domain-containing protein n=1 Tax=Gordonia rhizosphera NBRC 16068 TaxID=1108045 RepID=K6W1W3_9ACTN|nr:phage/plasmid primase, P4 family [Gordonia rhizosphera]GAB93155.1 hypothetical protein GORHZ_207_00040 [Gordonia rhizosphera NBRC 16068]